VVVVEDEAHFLVENEVVEEFGEEEEVENPTHTTTSHFSVWKKRAHGAIQ